MRQHSKWWKLLAVLLGLSLFAAACGDDDDDASEGDDTEEGSGSEEEEEPEEEDPAIAALRETGDADPDLATPAVEGHLANGVDAILGASASQISSNQIEAIIGACTIMFSPSNTGPVFTTYDDNDLYFRTAAADILQGRVLAELAIEEGVETATIIARQDPYGEGLLTYIKAGFEDAGGTIENEVVYGPEQTEFDTEIGEIVDADADGLFLVGFDESSTILSGLIEEGYTPEDKKIYFVEGNMGNSVGEAFTEPGSLTGIKGTIPGARVADEFRTRMLENDPALGNFTYGPETYDALVILSLAATAAGTDESAAVAREINGVTREGEECDSYEACLALLEADPEADIDYTGQSGPVDFARPGEPTAANYGIYTWNEDNTVNTEALEFKDTAL